MPAAPPRLADALERLVDRSDRAGGSRQRPPSLSRIRSRDRWPCRRGHCSLPWPGLRVVAVARHSGRRCATRQRALSGQLHGRRTRSPREHGRGGRAHRARRVGARTGCEAPRRVSCESPSAGNPGRRRHRNRDSAVARTRPCRLPRTSDTGHIGRRSGFRIQTGSSPIRGPAADGSARRKSSDAGCAGGP